MNKKEAYQILEALNDNEEIYLTSISNLKADDIQPKFHEFNEVLFEAYQRQKDTSK